MSERILIAVVVVGLLAFACVVAIYSANRTIIKDHVAARGGEVVSIDEHVWTLGPFWVKNKGQRIYKATLKDGRVVWMRTGVFGPDWIWVE